MLVIYHLTDPHARLGAEARPDRRLPGLVRPDRPAARETWTGLAAIDSLLAEELGRLPEDATAMLVCCGDAFGVEMAPCRDTKGGATARALDLLARHPRLAAALWLPGNHEVDHGVDRLLALRDGHLQMVADNLVVDGAPFGGSGVVEVGPYRLSVLALTAVQTCTEAPLAERPRLAVTPPLAAARAHEHADDAALTLVLAHTWDDEDLAIASSTGVDLLLGGHTHVERSEALPSGTRWEKAGAWAEVLGRVVLRERAGRLTVDPLETALLPLDVDPSGSPVLALERRVVEELDARDPRRLQPVARLAEPLRGLRSIRTAAPSPLGEAVARGVLLGARALAQRPVHCALLNAGNIRAEVVPRGNRVSLADLHCALPYDNQLVLSTVPAAALRQALHAAALNLKLDRAGWLRVAGVHARLDRLGQPVDPVVEVPEGHGVRLVPLDELDEVTIATFDFLAEGGHGFGFLGPGEGTGRHPADAWAEALLASGGPSILLRPPCSLLVDEGFRQTDPRVVLEAAETAFPEAWRHAGGLLFGLLGAGGAP